MNLFTLPWLELSVCVPLIGGLCVGWVRDATAALRWCLAFAGATLVSTLLVFAGQATGETPTGASPWDIAPRLFGERLLEVDALSAPLLPLVALLHLLTALATARTKMARFSFAWMLGGESLRLATFGCKASWVLVALLLAGAGLTYLELLRRKKQTRVYVLHMGLFACCLVGGWACLDPAGPVGSAPVASVLLFTAVLVRSGTVPFHAWVLDLFEHASFGTALLFATPITGAYLAVRLVLPVAPEWALQGISILSLVTACFAAGLAGVQTEARRFFAYLFLSHTSLVLVGLELHTPISLTGALFLWLSVSLSLSGLGLTLRALEARFGRLSLARFSGLYDHSPALAVCFLLTGLGSVGFPGALGFVGTELLVDGALRADPVMGVALVIAAAVNGIAVVRVYFLLFTGGRHLSSVSLAITLRERVAVLTLAVLILGGGLFPEPGVVSRYKAAAEVLKGRAAPRPPRSGGRPLGPSDAATLSPVTRASGPSENREQGSGSKQPDRQQRVPRYAGLAAPPACEHGRRFHHAVDRRRADCSGTVPVVTGIDVMTVTATDKDGGMGGRYSPAHGGQRRANGGPVAQMILREPVNPRGQPTKALRAAVHLTDVSLSPAVRPSGHIALSQ
jgi:NADH-quinone oxidoreductase subunit M